MAMHPYALVLPPQPLCLSFSACLLAHSLVQYLSDSFHVFLQVTVAILLNSFVGAINAAEEEAATAATQDMKSKEMLRFIFTSC
jgi:hypothetical protein